MSNLNNTSKMRRSRWDQKNDSEEPLPSSSNWNNRCSNNQINSEWNHETSPLINPVTNNIESVNSPHPLDYSKSSENRSEEDIRNKSLNEQERNKQCKESSESVPDHQPNMLQSPWPPFVPHMYSAGSSQNSQIPFQSQIPWNQSSHGFYTDANYHSGIFDLKWWNSIGGDLGINEEVSNKERQKYEAGRAGGNWSKLHKNNDRSFNYDFNRRFGRYQHMSYERNNRFCREQRQYIPNNNMNFRFNNCNTPNRLWRHNGRDYHGHNIRQDFSPFIWNQNINQGPYRSNNTGSFDRKKGNFSKSFNDNLFKNKNSKKKVSKTSKKNGIHKVKNTKKKDSTAEKAKKQALAVAANKLKMIFLAAKKKPGKKNGKKHKEEIKNQHSIEKNDKENVQDLSIPKSIPKEGTSLEHDIDIKFSASEWESVGRGEGGTRNLDDLPGSKQSKEIDDEDGENSDSDSVQTVEEVETKESTDIETDNSESCSDDEGTNMDLNDDMKYSQDNVRRRRHASESCNAKILNNKYPNLSKARRVRSYSTSQVDECSPFKNDVSKPSIAFNLKNMLLKQLLMMDKKSLEELVNNPKSRKAQFMMSHFMKMHRAALSQKLNQIRFKNMPSASNDEDLQILQTIGPAQLENLPVDVIQQVKDIIAFEESGKAQQMWEEVSLSLSDLFSGFDEPNQDEEKMPESTSSAEDISNKNSASENSDDLDCQIVTPPPKRPATTITIPDSDNEILNENNLENKNTELKIPSLPSNTVKNVNQNDTLVSNDHLSDCFIKPQDLTHLRINPFIRQSSMSSISQSLTHQFTGPRRHSIKESPATPVEDHSLSPPHQLSSPLPSPNPTSSFRHIGSIKRLKGGLGSKTKIGNSLSVGEAQCDINLPTPSVKVKQERPSPMMECGYCMHPPRSPHTPQCGFSFGIPAPPPVPLISGGSPRPLRPVPHLANASLPRMFKQEKPEAVNFVSLDHVNRPSSEERPKNPAPPDNASSEPPSPLPIPPPSQTLHPPPPRPLIFSQQVRFPDPPRPASPPPPQHSPRIIKTERQTPQYICCCMRNECERNTGSNAGSRPDSDFRRPATPLQNQLCEVANRLTPHLYKMEPPFISGARSRTPHSSIIGMFPMPPSPRCIGSTNSMNNHCLNLNDASAKASVGVQTDNSGPSIIQEVTNYIPRISLPHSPSVIPFSNKMDQMTSTDDLQSVELRIVPPAETSASLRNNERKSSVEIYESERKEDSQISEFSKTNNNEIIFESSNTTSMLMQMAKQELEILQRLEAIEKKSQELANERITLSKFLEDINLLRIEKVSKLTQIASRDEYNNDVDSSLIINQSTDIEVSTNSHIPLSPSSSTKEISENTSTDNPYLVTSSQEDLLVNNRGTDSPTGSCSNDSELNSGNANNIQGQRCTSTSLITNENDLSIEGKRNSSGSDSDGENKEGSYEHENYFGTECILSLSFDEESLRKDDNSHPTCANSDCVLEISTNNDTHIENEMKQEDQSIIISEFGSVEINENLEPIRKASFSSSPQSPKMRNSSGSEHGYSLRSRGPPSDLFDFNSDSQLSKDMIPSQEDNIDIIEEKDSSLLEKTSVKYNSEIKEENKEMDNYDEIKTCSTIHGKLSTNENIRRKKRKRKNSKKGQINKTKRRNEEEMSESCGTDEIVKLPPPHSSAILDLKVVGDFIFTASSDSTARLYDPKSGFVLATYTNHNESVTAIQVVGQPDFRPVAPDFQVVTGSDDGLIHVYEGKTGILSKSRNSTEPIRCLNYRWGYLFVGTDGGCGIKWNLKDKKLGEKIQFSGKGITQLITHMEGGRKVLVVGSKTTPIMVRDAMSGLFLRTLEYVQLTVYSAIFEGSLLYTGGADKNIYCYDFCGGSVKKTLDVGASVSSLLLVSGHLIATCYDGYVRIFKLPEGELKYCVPVESSHKMFICSALYKNNVLLGNKNGDVDACRLPKL